VAKRKVCRPGGKKGAGSWTDGYESDEFGMNAILLKYARNAHTQTHPLTHTHTQTLNIEATNEMKNGCAN